MWYQSLKFGLAIFMNEYTIIIIIINKKYILSIHQLFDGQIILTLKIYKMPFFDH